MVDNVELQPFDERVGINTAGIQGVGAEAEGELFALPSLLGGGSSGNRKQLKDKELVNARVAMIGVLVTVLIELVNGKSLVHLFGNQ